jgi:hypothetical protein
MDWIILIGFRLYLTILDFQLLPEIWIVGITVGLLVRPIWATILIAVAAGFIAARLLHGFDFDTLVNALATLLWALLARGFVAFAKWQPRAGQHQQPRTETGKEADKCQT